MALGKEAQLALADLADATANGAVHPAVSAAVVALAKDVSSALAKLASHDSKITKLTEQTGK